MIGSLLENRFAATHFERFVKAAEHYLSPCSTVIGIFLLHQRVNRLKLLIATIAYAQKT
jgi:hypothetical protein